MVKARSRTRGIPALERKGKEPRHDRANRHRYGGPPLGSVHPKHPNLRYPVNYGYVKGVPAPDGEDQDAYILGVDGPVREFTGQVLAVIHRLDDVEDKWVVVPEGTRFTKEEIMERVRFQERFFQTEIEL